LTNRCFACGGSESPPPPPLSGQLAEYSPLAAGHGLPVQRDRRPPWLQVFEGDQRVPPTYLAFWVGRPCMPLDWHSHRDLCCVHHSPSSVCPKAAVSPSPITAPGPVRQSGLAGGAPQLLFIIRLRGELRNPELSATMVAGGLC
jgi:hypothetical protein